MKPQNNRMQQPVPANSLFSFSPGRYIPAITAFGLLCLCFSPLLVNFIWGNHDWLPLIHGNPLLSGLIEGRFSQYILLNLLLDGKILPVLNILLGFIFYTAALFLLYRRFFAFSVRPAIAALFLVCRRGAALRRRTAVFSFHNFQPVVLAVNNSLIPAVLPKSVRLSSCYFHALRHTPVIIRAGRISCFSQPVCYLRSLFYHT